MYRCILIKRWWLVDDILEIFIRRTECLELIWSGAYSDEAIDILKSEKYHLVFASLPSPNALLYKDFFSELGREPQLILSSIYPEHMFNSQGFEPVIFLKEPVSISQFEHAIAKFIEKTLDNQL